MTDVIRHKTTEAAIPAGTESQSTLLTVARRLESVYGSPRLGNPYDPLDDLIFVLLSGRTSPRLHVAAYEALKKSFKSWEEASQATPSHLFMLIRGAGFGMKRADQISGLLRALARKTGSVSLEFLRALPDREVEEILTDLPGVGIKTARCVMLYTLGRATFPVDAHVRRILSYFGLVNPLVRLEYAQDPLQAFVPAELRYSLHVNLVEHGRATCKAVRPDCSSCALSDMCSRATSELSSRNKLRRIP